jgi:pimeloyl-ACP methyl ester carboxylesterase
MENIMHEETKAVTRSTQSRWNRRGFLDGLAGSAAAMFAMTPMVQDNLALGATLPEDARLAVKRTDGLATYVLIHGSWHGAWCWHKITPRLEAAGHKVIVPDMPGHGRDWTAPGQVTMRDYVDTITRILDAERDPVVLVVHSRSGIPVTQAAEERPDKIRRIIYLAALLPPIGNSVSMAQSRRENGWAHDPESLSGRNVDVNREAGSDMLRSVVFREALYADCSDEDVALSHALLTPEPRGAQSPTETPIRTTRENFGRIPRVYIELTQDKAVSWPCQKRMYMATPCDHVMSIDASHSAYFSRPDELARKILIAGEEGAR